MIRGYIEIVEITRWRGLNRRGSENNTWRKKLATWNENKNNNNMNSWK